MAKPLKKIIWFAVAAVLAASVFPNVFSRYWLVDLFAHFKVQYLVVSIILVPIVFLFLKARRVALLFLTVSILWNAYFILPYYFSFSKKVPLIKKTLKLSSINLLSSNSKTDEVKNYIEKEDADVLVLMEFTPQWEQELSGLNQKYSFVKVATRTDNFGIALLSKYKMEASVHYFGRSQKPTIVGDLSIDGKKLSVVATHPVPPINQSTFKERNAQLKSIAQKRKTFSDNLIIIGDFNTSSFSNHFGQLTKFGLKDSRIGFGLLPTWPANFVIMQTTLDHCLVSPSIIIQERSVGYNLGSDHLPINIVIGLD